MEGARHSRFLLEVGESGCSVVRIVSFVETTSAGEGLVKVKPMQP